MASDKGSPTVLIVDDDLLDVRMAQRVLQRLGAYGEIVVAANGEEALERIAEHKPSIVYLDINMPLMNGFEFLEAFSQQENTDDPPIVVMLTSEEPSLQRQRAESFSVVKGFASKPLTKALAALHAQELIRGD